MINPLISWLISFGVVCPGWFAIKVEQRRSRGVRPGPASCDHLNRRKMPPSGCAARRGLFGCGEFRAISSAKSFSSVSRLGPAGQLAIWFVNLSEVGKADELLHEAAPFGNGMSLRRRDR